MKAVFLDRDGVLNPMGKHVNHPDDFELIPGVAQALHRLSINGFKLFLVTNQAGVAFGHMTEEDLGVIHQRMLQLLLKEGRVQLSSIHYCCMHPQGTVEKYRGDSPRRKPGTGMFEEILEQYRAVDPTQSIMVGDTFTDILPAKRLGMITYFVGPEFASDGGADYRKPSLVEVVDHLMAFWPDLPPKPFLGI